MKKTLLIILILICFTISAREKYFLTIDAQDTCFIDTPTFINFKILDRKERIVKNAQYYCKIESSKKIKLLYPSNKFKPAEFVDFRCENLNKNLLFDNKMFLKYNAYIVLRSEEECTAIISINAKVKKKLLPQIKKEITFYNKDRFIDTDKDGIFDFYDRDRTHKEDFDGYKDNDGKPDYDNDNDGLSDTQEILLGYDPNNPDMDNDKVKDGKDKAPLIPEDIDYFQDLDGVPDYDNDNDGLADTEEYLIGSDPLLKDTDGDGIDDKDDSDPVRAETINGYKDNDGAPDEIPEKIVFSDVSFEFNSAVIKKDFYPQLDNLGLMLESNPELFIRIEGHTDSVGSFEYNQRLSQKRAQAIKKYLVKNFIIDGNRIQCIGYGEKRPIGDNTTEAGRAMNRRIEIIIKE